MRRSALLLVLASLLACTAAAATPSRRSGDSPLDGRWTWTWTHDELVRNGAKVFDARTLAGEETILFANGRYKAHNLTTGRVDGGTFTINGDLVTLTHDIGPPSVRPATMRYSLFRDRLTWKLVPGRNGWSAFTITPWVRAG